MTGQLKVTYVSWVQMKVTTYFLRVVSEGTDTSSPNSLVSSIIHYSKIFTRSEQSYDFFTVMMIPLSENDLGCVNFLGLCF